MIKTIKRYYEDMNLLSCSATILEIDKEKGIVLDQTVAYPEGGG
jgi:Ser-tRNA(Ala) deacylase AlaX